MGRNCKKFPTGSNQKVTVRNFTNFGIFVELEEGVDGLIHISDLSWEKKIKHPSDFTKVGEVIEAQVLELGFRSKKVESWCKTIVMTIHGMVMKVYSTKALSTKVKLKISQKMVQLLYLLTALNHLHLKRHLVKEDDSKVAVGEKLNFRVLEFQKILRKIIVSHTVIFKEVKMEEAKKTKKKLLKFSNLNKKYFGRYGRINCFERKHG